MTIAPKPQVLLKPRFIGLPETVNHDAQHPDGLGIKNRRTSDLQTEHAPTWSRSAALPTDRSPPRFERRAGCRMKCEMLHNIGATAYNVGAVSDNVKTNYNGAALPTPVGAKGDVSRLFSLRALGRQGARAAASMRARSTNRALRSEADARAKRGCTHAEARQTGARAPPAPLGFGESGTPQNGVWSSASFEPKNGALARRGKVAGTMAM